MRDVYLSPSQRGAYERILARAATYKSALASDTGERGVVGLVAKWNTDADGYDAIGCVGLASIKRDCAEQLRAALRAQPAGGGVCVYCDAYNASVQEAALTQPQPVDEPCGCRDYCADHGREDIEVTPDSVEYCNECSSDGGTGELCTPMPDGCDMLNDAANVQARSFMCPAHAAEHVKFCAEARTPPESGGQGVEHIGWEGRTVWPGVEPAGWWGMANRPDEVPLAHPHTQYRRIYAGPEEGGV